MSLAVDGATRLVPILGDPIAQVKSPAGMSAALQARGANALVVPMQVPPAALPGVLAALAATGNVDGLIATIPHKFACFAACATASPRATLLRAANILRRTPAGWHGEMLDGEGFVAAIRAAGREPHGQRALLLGAGGAGSAIGLALLEAGVAELRVHDPDAARSAALVARLGAAHPGRVRESGADPAGCDLVLNACPLGMRAADPIPLNPALLSPAMFLGCVITAPTVTPLTAAARARGCATSTGADMYAQVQRLMLDFLLA